MKIAPKGLIAARLQEKKSRLLADIMILPTLSPVLCH
jgi:hypothetical protein